jgi:hypothetical protein
MRLAHKNYRKYQLNDFAQPLAPAGGAAADATKDPMLKHEKYGAHLLEIRKR